ncbi:MAG: hypothetical protein ACYTGN_05975 [Planctomycetota bacterium]|jgi:hypothetical protein
MQPGSGLALVLLLAACSPQEPPAPAPPKEPPAPRVTPRVIYYTLGES